MNGATATGLATNGNRWRVARASTAETALREALSAETPVVDGAAVDGLIRAHQQGDAEALTEIYKLYFDTVYGYARVVLRDDYEAENVTQQVFTTVVEALPEYEIRDDQPFRAWLMRIARNTAIDACRRTNRSRPTDPGQLGLEEAVEPEAVVSVLTWLKDSDLALFVDRLPEAQREVVILRYLLGHELCEIARILGKSPDSVYRTHSRALRTLEKRLTAIGRRPSKRRRMATLIRIKPAPVLAARRFAIASSATISRPLAALVGRRGD
ncbi:MAG: RNA polymerase sigma factor [Solirubrobacterales bacterium]